MKMCKRFKLQIEHILPELSYWYGSLCWLLFDYVCMFTLFSVLVEIYYYLNIYLFYGFLLIVSHLLQFTLYNEYFFLILSQMVRCIESEWILLHKYLLQINHIVNSLKIVIIMVIIIIKSQFLSFWFPKWQY